MSYVCVVNSDESKACIYRLVGAADNDKQREDVMRYIQGKHPEMVVTLASDEITMEQYQAMCEPGIRH